MMRWRAAILMLVALTAPGRGQETDQVHALTKRVLLKPEDDSANPLNLYDDEARASLAGNLLLSSPPHFTSGYAILAGVVLEHQATERYEKALAEYLRILQDDEAKLLHPPLHEYRGTDGLTSRDAQTVAQQWLSRLPRAILNRYRQQFDAEATRLLAEGCETRDPAPLRRLVRDYRACAQANKALAVLGDLAFERGEFDQALGAWRWLVPLPSHQLINRQAGDPRPVRDGVDVVRIHAKQTLALIFSARPEAARERDAFRSLYPTERGALAGRNDAYHAILTHWLTARGTLPDAEIETGWPTFAGAANRNRVIGKAPSPRLWIDGPTWRMPLADLGPQPPPVAWLTTTRSVPVPSMPYHPIIANGQVLVSDGQCVRSYDLFTGKPLFRAPPRGGLLFGEARSYGRSFGLSAAAGRAFARVGDHLGDSRPKKLICLDLLATGINAGRTLWSVSAGDDEAGAFFDTDPLVLGDRVYIGAALAGENQSTRFLHCFDLNGVPQWRTPLAEIINRDNPDLSHSCLLVAAGSAIIDATQSGVVVAVDSWTGRRLWAFRYPSLDAGPSPRGASSCLAAHGRVFLAPADSPNLYCLDAETGRSLWERPWIKGPSDIVPGPPAVSEIVDLLGVADDRLIFTDRTRLQALDIWTGGTLEWQQPVVGKLPVNGRGLLAGDWVFWPTADKEVSWRVVSQSRGTPRQADAEPEYYDPTMLRGLPSGNIVFGNGCLVIAGPKEMVVYVPAAAQLPQLERDPQARFQPAKLFRLAMAQRDSGRKDESAATFARLERTAPPADLADWRQLIRERTAPRPSVRLPAIGPRADGEPPSPKSASVAPLDLQANQLRLAWGPIAGLTLPVEYASGTSADIAILLDGPEIAFLNGRKGAEIFRLPRRIIAVDWIGREGASVLVAGREGIEAFDLKERRSIWWFEAPARTESYWRLVNDAPRRIVAKARLVDFQLRPGRLICAEDQRRMIALDTKSGAVVTERWSAEISSLTSDQSPWPASAWFSAVDMKTPGREDTIPTGQDADAVIDLAEATRRCVPLLGGWQLRGETHGKIAIARIDRDSEVFYQPRWPTSLTGAPAHVFGDESLLMAVVPRNHGHELIRFDRSLRPLWSLPPTELPAGFDVLTAAWDDRAIYFVHAGVLQSRDRAKGTLLWKTALPAASGPWRVECFAGGVIAWPQSHAGLPALSGPVDPIIATLTLAFGRRHIGSVPILFVDSKDGSAKQRLDVPHDGGPVFVNRHGPRLIVAAGGMVRAWTAEP